MILCLGLGGNNLLIWSFISGRILSSNLSKTTVNLVRPKGTIAVLVNQILNTLLSNIKPRFNPPNIVTMVLLNFSSGSETIKK